MVLINNSKIIQINFLNLVKNLHFKYKKQIIYKKSRDLEITNNHNKIKWVVFYLISQIIITKVNLCSKIKIKIKYKYIYL